VTGTTGHPGKVRARHGVALSAGDPRRCPVVAVDQTIPTDPRAW
jgi:hypothetical protein